MQSTNTPVRLTSRVRICAVLGLPSLARHERRPVVTSGRRGDWRWSVSAWSLGAGVVIGYSPIGIGQMTLDEQVGVDPGGSTDDDLRRERQLLGEPGVEVRLVLDRHLGLHPVVAQPA